MTGKKPRDSCKQIFFDLNIFTLTGLYIYELLVWVHTNKASFVNNQFNHPYETRNKFNFRYRHHKLKVFEQTPQHIGLKAYNHLPQSIKSLDLKHFKIEIKDRIIKKVYYSFEDYLKSPFN